MAVVRPIADTRSRSVSFRCDSQLQQYILEGVSPTGKELGRGSYGCVIEVQYQHTICAAKEIHEILLDPRNQGVADVIKKYQGECQLISSVSHPNLTKFLGLCFVKEDALPLLVMERLEMSLEELIEGARNASLQLRLSLLHDTCSGLAYLHSREPPIVHRDLTARNVLISSSMSAKIADFGCSCMVELQPGQLVQTLSKVPGTLLYMPPEALADNSHRYGPSLDIFSFGHLSLYTIIQKSPQYLLPSTYPNPSNMEITLARSEVERRQRYMDELKRQVNHSYPDLLQLVRLCLHNAPEKRPCSEDIFITLSLVKIKAEGSVGCSKRQEDSDKDQKVQEMLKNLASKVQSLQAELQTLKNKYENVNVNSSVEESDQNGKTSTQDLVKEKFRVNPLELNWTNGPDIPLNMSGNIQSVEINGTLFVGGGTAETEEEYNMVMAYDIMMKLWRTLAPYKANRFGMAAFRKKLVLVGGWIEGGNVDSVAVYQMEFNRWTYPFPPMTMARQLPSTTSYKHWLIVAGGYSRFKALSAVEVLDVNNKQWSIAPSTPKPWYHMKSTVINDTWYLMGGFCNKTTVGDVYCVSLEALVSHPTSEDSTVWNEVASLKYFSSSPLSVGESLLAVGGWNEETKTAVSTIQCYVPESNTWVRTQAISKALYDCTCIQTGNKIYVIGGHDGTNKLASTYICII